MLLDYAVRYLITVTSSLKEYSDQKVTNLTLFFASFTLQEVPLFLYIKKNA